MAKNAIEKIAMNAAENIPYDKLMLSQKNVRRIKDGVSIEQLAEDIGRRKLIQSLNVRPVLDGEGEETGTFEVPAGGRRYLALGILIKQKRLAKNEPIPCIVNRGQETSAEEDSLAENLRRADLHPLDQFRAFKTLSDQGLDPDEIGARFFVSSATVRQRLRLASVSPKLLDLYEKDEIRLEQLMAFSIADDHARQEQVWERIASSHTQEPYYIRRLLTETTVRADDRRAVYVGAEAYEAAGGIILRDLFEQDSGGWFQDAGLLEQLVFDRLKMDAEAIRTDGWKWVEAAISFPYGHTSGMRRIYAEAQELSAEEIERYDALKAEYAKLDADYAQAEDADEAIEAKLDQLGAELDAIDDRPQSYDPAQKSIAGVFVTLAANGKLQVDAGFVRSEDEPRTEPGDVDEGEEGSADGGNRSNGDDDGDGVVVNGKPVNDASGDDGEDDRIKPLPDRLVFDLTAQRTLALRNALAGDVDIAFVAALHAFVLQVFYRFAPDTCLEISLKSGSFSQVDGLAETSWAKEVAERHEAWDRDLPDEAEALWDFLLGLDEASRKALFAHCVSLTLNAVVEPWNRRPKALEHADRLGRSLQFDMVDAGWTPTVEFLGRLTKARILQAVREARGADSAQLIDHMKKDIMAREAARLLEGSNWLPEPLRLEVDEVVSDAGDAVAGEMSEEAAPDDDAAELPAFLADDADPSSDEPVTIDGDEADHLQAAE
ncbi:ParB/RepB/Spo0J family partition protein [Mesorhizobium sp. 131-2-1]|uniref:ParB/RepB/Spo0J family partition protein n=1 Tax=Mesorhizobium sp. 131-2-1 TaxID=2744518 RepID=UPI0018EE2346|nr:ParB/RepB/Spo0J family partition protein [Mesorhizobium sp. 131-2-1]BCG97793.1 chromosome partitioning protein ParB [Mesorhizobium sp. 131-2-1]